MGLYFFKRGNALIINEFHFCLVTKEIKLGNVSQTLTALPPYKGTEKNSHFQIKTMTMCHTLVICRLFKTRGISLRILQLRGFWHYDIMSDLQMWIKPLHMCIKVYENMDIKICFCGDKCVYALWLYCYSVEMWEKMAKYINSQLSHINHFQTF